MIEGFETGDHVLHRSQSYGIVKHVQSGGMVTVQFFGVQGNYMCWHTTLKLISEREYQTALAMWTLTGQVKR